MTALLLLAAIVACEEVPSDRLTWRESWEMTSIGEDGTVLHGRVVVGNTGLLRGQGHVVLDVLPPSGTPIQLRRDVPPSALTRSEDGRTLVLGGDELAAGPDSWTLSVREGYSALDATIVLSADQLPADPTTGGVPEVPSTEILTGERSWAVGVPLPLATLAGAWRAGEQGGLLRGAGMAVRRSGDTLPSGDPPRTSLHVCDPRWSLGVETAGTSGIAWLADATGVRTSRSVVLSRDGGRVLVDLAPDLPVTVRVQLEDRVIYASPWRHHLLFERWLVRLLLAPEGRETRRGRARVRTGEKSLEARAVYVLSAPPSRAFEAATEPSP